MSSSNDSPARRPDLILRMEAEDVAEVLGDTHREGSIGVGGRDLNDLMDFTDRMDRASADLPLKSVVDFTDRSDLSDRFDLTDLMDRMEGTERSLSALLLSHVGSSSDDDQWLTSFGVLLDGMSWPNSLR